MLRFAFSATEGVGNTPQSGLNFNFPDPALDLNSVDLIQLGGLLAPCSGSFPDIPFSRGPEGVVL